MANLLPDLSLRQPSVTALVPLFMTYYALAVLVILPKTFILRLLLQPVFVWQAWRCIADVDVAAWLAQSLGLKSAVRLNFFNSPLPMIFIMVLRSFEWAFITKGPIRRYKSTMDQDDPGASKRLLSFSNILLDAFELLFNLRGIGWSWSPKSSPRRSPALPSESILSVFATLLLNIVVYDATQYLIQCACTTINSDTSAGSLFDPNLSLFPRNALAAFAGICGGVWAYSLVEIMYGIGTLVGRVVLRQPASSWPPVSHRPWLSTSLHEFWSVRWHQLFRHIFITFGARPGGALLGRPGAIIGGSAVSAALHHVAVWGLGNGSEFSTAGGFFLLMGLGTVMEVAFKKATGMRVQGVSGWLWTMLWVLVWGTRMLDGWARHGMLANDFVPDRLRLGKALVDAIIGLPKTRK